MFIQWAEILQLYIGAFPYNYMGSLFHLVEFKKTNLKKHKTKHAIMGCWVTSEKSSMLIIDSDSCCLSAEETVLCCSRFRTFAISCRTEY